MKNNITLAIFALIFIAALAITNSVFFFVNKSNQTIQSQTVAVKAIGSNIIASGSIHSESEATLHFQTGGKLTYLPVKQGDTLYQGQTIAQLDTYPIQQALTQALNNYKSTRDTFDQTQENNQTGVTQNTDAFALNSQQAALGGGNTENNIINDMAKRLADQSQNNLNNAVINVQLANYALQLATLTAPFNGILVNEDVTVAGQNITPTTGFTVADPSQLVFRAQVDASDIDFVSLGAAASVQISGQTGTISGTVVKIYPQKTTLASGEDVYAVDIQSNDIQQQAKLGQSGSVLITSSAAKSTVTVPTWAILGHNQIWVEENNTPVLRTVTIGKIHGNTTEILSGLKSTARVVVNPKTIAAQKYSVL